MMETETIKRSGIVTKVIAVVLLAALLIVSVAVFSKAAGDPARYVKTLASLDAREKTVLEMTAASAAAATAIAAVPGDATTPVADELADLASYFVVIMTVVIVEKYLVAVIGYAAYAYLIPAGCVLGIVGTLLGKGPWKRWAIKLGVCGLLISLAIPFSMGVSELIEAKADVTFEATLDEAQQITEEINENTDEEGNFITKAWDKITGGISGLADRGEELFVDFLESIAVLLATSCVIPIAVLLAALWAIKTFFGVSFHMPASHKGIGRSKDTNDAD